MFNTIRKKLINAIKLSILLPMICANSIFGSGIKYLGKEEGLENDGIPSTVLYYCKEKYIYIHISTVENTIKVPALWSVNNSLNKSGPVKCIDYYLWLDEIADK